MSPQTFKDYWQSTYRVAPISYLFRQAYPQRWWRLHSLPQAQRYANNDAEMTEILYRHNTVLRAMFAKAATFALVIANHRSDPWPAEMQRLRVTAYPALQLFLDLVREEEDEAPQYWQFFFQIMSWHDHVTDDLLRLVANDEIENLIYADITTPRLYLPYDGGADIICTSRAERQKMSDRFAEWRSQHPDGL